MGTGKLPLDSGLRRRKPAQRRARTTVDAIALAAVSLFRENGYGDTTTNHIAERAGVSIGSLYQYFKNKEAIVVYVYDNAITKLAKGLKHSMETYLLDDYRQSIPLILDSLLTMLEENEFEIVRLIEDVPSITVHTANASLDLLVYSISKLYIAQHQNSINQEVNDLIVYFVGKILLDRSVAYVKESPKKLDRRVFVRELSLIAILYIENRLEENAIFDSDFSPM